MNYFIMMNFCCDKAFIHKDIHKNTDYHYTCIDKKGNILFELEPKTHCLWFEDENVAFVDKPIKDHHELTAVINHKGEFLTDFVYDCIYGGSEDGFFEVIKNGKHGHIDTQGCEIIPCIYETGCYFLEGIASEKLDGKWGCVDFKNNTVIPFVYEETGFCKNNIIPAKLNGKYGLIDKSNNVLCDFKFDYIYSFGDRDNVCTLAQKDSKTGFVDKFGDVVVDFEYDIEESCEADDNGNYYKIKKNGKYALFSCKKGRFITDFIYSDIGHFTTGLFEVKLKNKAGFIDTEGNEIIPLIYDKTDEFFYENVVTVIKNDKYGLIDRCGNIIIPIIYKKISVCSDGLCLVRDFDDKVGFINKRNELVIPFGKYHNCQGFHCGLAIASDGMGQHYINTDGEIVITPSEIIG